MVSVIIPVFNAEKYIDDCLKSVSNQNYSNIEILIINDGSVDNSLMICEKWKELDSRIAIYTRENCGVSNSRNFGLDKSKGQYVTFVDADDVIAEDCVSILVEMLEKDSRADCSIIRCSVSENSFSSGESIYLKREESKKAIYTYLGGFACGRLFTSNVIKQNNLRFDTDIAVCEDLIFNDKYLDNSSGIVYADAVKYFYRQHQQSAFHNLNNLKWFDCIKAYGRLLEKATHEEFLILIYKYLQLLYEAKYRAKFLKNDSISMMVREEFVKNEHYKKQLAIKQKFKLLVYKYFYRLVVFLRNKRQGS